MLGNEVLKIPRENSISHPEKNFDNNFICDDLPLASGHSKEMNNIF